MPRPYDQHPQDHRAQLMRDRHMQLSPPSARCKSPSATCTTSIAITALKRPPRRPIGRLAPAQPRHHAKGKQHIAHHPVNELHQPGILKERRPDRPPRHIKRIRREERPVHIRPGRKRPPRINPRHQRAQQYLQEQQMHHPGRHALQPPLAIPPRLQQIGL